MLTERLPTLHIFYKTCSSLNLAIVVTMTTEDITFPRWRYVNPRQNVFPSLTSCLLSFSLTSTRTLMYRHIIQLIQSFMSDIIPEKAVSWRTIVWRIVQAASLDQLGLRIMLHKLIVFAASQQQWGQRKMFWNWWNTRRRLYFHSLVEVNKNKTVYLYFAYFPLHYSWVM